MSSLGDVVHALPAVTDAARNGVRFHWVVEEAFQAVPAAHPAVEKVLPIAWRRWRRRLWRSRGELKAFFGRLAGERYDLAIDSQGLVKSALAMKGATARERVGFCRDSAKEPLSARFYDRCVEVPRHRHAVDRQRQLFAGALGYACDDAAALDFGLNRKDIDWDPVAHDTRPESGREGSEGTPAHGIAGGEEAPARGGERGGGTPGHGSAGSGEKPTHGGDGSSDRTPTRGGRGSTPVRRTSPGRCVLLHGATWTTKLWPEAMWVELARMAAGSGLEVRLPWGNAEERARAERIAGAGSAALLGNLSLGEFMDELRGARLVVGVDSGLAHLAGALGVPTLVLYGSTSSELTGCRGNVVRNLQADFPCSPCLARSCRYRGPAVHWRETAVRPPCYGELGPERVWAAALETMDAHRLLHI